jgi:8-oxo-dGTP diphosphatase
VSISAVVPEGYDPSHYERPSVTVDVVIFALLDERLQVLLIQRDREPYASMWALPGGFVGMDESLEAAAARELAEETGLTNVHMEQLHTFGAPDRDPRTRVITVAYLALVHGEVVPLRAGDDARAAGWFATGSLPPLAFDHGEILALGLSRLRHKVAHSPAECELLPDTFTLAELQRAYEIILGEGLDRRRFRHGILASGALEEAGGQRRRGGGRPARLYRYRQGVAD